MATVRREIATDPAGVWDVLSDGWTYSNWVVGTSHMRSVGPDWPAAGSRLEHATGAWPAVIRDETVVTTSEPRQRLVLLAKGSVLGQARVELTLRPTDGGTEVSITEYPVSGLGKVVYNRVADAFTAARNVEALRRLAALAEHRTPAARARS